MLRKLLIESMEQIFLIERYTKLRITNFKQHCTHYVVWIGCCYG